MIRMDIVDKTGKIRVTDVTGQEWILTPVEEPEKEEECPRAGDVYYWTSGDGGIMDTTWQASPGDMGRLEMGMVFRTKKEAVGYIERRKAYMRIRRWIEKNCLPLMRGDMRFYIVQDDDGNIRYSSSTLNFDSAIWPLATTEDAEKVIEACQTDLELVFNK